MASALAVFGRHDLRSVRREPLLIGVMCAPLVWIAMVRFGTPAVADMLWERYGLDLVPYYPLVLTGFLLLTSPIVVGGVAAFLVLEERDTRTLAALRVTPVSLRTFTAYRAATALFVTAIYVVATMLSSGLVPAHLAPELIVIGLGTGALGVMFALLILALARNQIEGIAVLRATAIILAGLPLIPYFVRADWQLVFGLIPTYWPSKAYWVAAAGGVWWPYVVAGVVYSALLAWPLYRRFQRSV